jgi:N-acyl-D-amino-acid deacylase
MLRGPVPGLSVLAICALCSWQAAAEERYDVLIRGGRVVDGTGSPWFHADVAIREGKIVRIGRIAEETQAGRVIDASGRIVAPGFIDMMGQTAVPMLRDPETALNLLSQGITTINAGEGHSAAPLSEEQAKSQGWRTMAEYFQLLDMRGLPVNVAQTVGHTQIRRLVLGEVDRRPTEEELERMKGYVEEAMQAGAIGVSTALIYPPATFAEMEEIAALCEVAGQYGGGYFTHMRNEGDRLLEAIEEALEIGRAAGVPVHIFHLKTAGERNWGKMEQALARIKAARFAGQQVTADVYPYIHNGLGLAAFIHPRHFSEGRSQLMRRLDEPALQSEIREEMETTGGWENWFRHVGGDWDRVIIGRTSDARYAVLHGQSLQRIAEQLEVDPWETFFRLVRADTFALPRSMSEANKHKAMQEPFVSFCTDVGPAGGSRIASHPRGYGSFPRLLSRYVRELGVLSLERAIAQGSAAAANGIMAYDRGRIAEGLAADVIIFDYDRITDRATFAEPDRLSKGMEYVLVNGELVYENGTPTGKRPGRVLRGPGFRPEQAPCRVSNGQADPRFESFDRLIKEFMQRHAVPGAALAVTDRGRLVYARGYGYADVADKKPVTSASLFRIASISKPVTAVAILQLAEREKLKLDDPVLDHLDLEPVLEDGAAFDERYREITLRHLLEHRGGWDREQSFDAMFRARQFAEALGIDAPAGPHEVIRVMLGKPLDFHPGERYAYSNLGYCLLGRVIEKRTGQSYEAYVREQVLAPLGIESMRIGRTLREDRCAGEVCYYDPGVGESVFQHDLGQTVPFAYGCWHLEAMDAHGGWIASAVDLARFASAFDDPENCPVLSAASIREMYARPTGSEESGSEEDSPTYYSLGWSNRIVGEGRRNHWHTGSLPGTSTLLVRRHDGRNWVVLFNARVSPHASHLAREIDGPLHGAANSVMEWPEHDLFDVIPAP